MPVKPVHSGAARELRRAGVGGRPLDDDQGRTRAPWRNDWPRRRLLPEPLAGHQSAADQHAGGTLAGIYRIWLLLVPSRSARPGLAPRASCRRRGPRLTALGNLDLAWH